ncbi:cell division protein CrgA [Alloscardovia venturai]|uniref:Cell division protein CrgA n=1 Tax=Alloscardovia venturai TaxID=1769421 RepID=A0ABW2Y4X9_9BIFI
MAEIEETQETLERDLDQISIEESQTAHDDSASQEDTTTHEDESGEELSAEEAAGVRAAQALKKVLDNPDGLSANAQRAVKRTEEETKRVEKAIEGTKSNPVWFVALFSFFLVLGLVWVIAYYIKQNSPIPGIGFWNLVIGFAIMMVGFIMMMWWR